MEYEDEQLVEEQLVEEPIEGEEDDFEDIEEEGDIAADYLEELLDIADLGGDIDIDIDHGRASIAVVASEEGDERELADLVGRDGEVLEAVQELTRLAVQARTGNRSRLMLGLNGHRARRRPPPSTGRARSRRRRCRDGPRHRARRSRRRSR